MTKCLAIRGATTAEGNTKDAIINATTELLLEIVRVNDLVIEEDRVEFELNGAALPFEKFKTTFDVDGFVYKWIEYDLTRGPLPRKGLNKLDIRLKERCEGITAPLTLKQLEVLTRYR